MNAAARLSEPTTPLVEEHLRSAMLAYLSAYGFTKLHLTNKRLEGEIAREHRAELFLEGWIA